MCCVLKHYVSNDSYIKPLENKENSTIKENLTSGKKTSKAKGKKSSKKTVKKDTENIELNIRKIIVYPEESDILTVVAKAKNVEVTFIEEDILPDIKNKKMIVPRYSIKPNEKDFCPFLKNNQCSIYDQRPLSCRAYPILIYGLESYNFSLDIDFSCQSLKAYNRLGKNFENIDMEGIKKLFPIEFRAINQIFNREKQVLQIIKKIIDDNKTDFQEEFSLEDFKVANEKWERYIIYTENI